MKVLQQKWPSQFRPSNDKPYEVEVEEGDDLVGVKCERNGCTEFKPGDRVLLIGRGLHTEHHEQAVNALRGLFGGSR